MKGKKVSEYKPQYLKALYFKGGEKKGRKEGRGMRKTKRRKEDNPASSAN